MAQKEAQQDIKRPAPPIVPFGAVPASDFQAGTGHFDIDGQLYEYPNYRAAPVGQRGAAPDFLSGLRTLTDPLGALLGNAADAVEPALTGPLPDSLKDLELAREFTLLPSLLRARRANLEGRSPTPEDLIGSLPGGAIGAGVIRSGKIGRAGADLLSGVPLNAEQLAARIGAKIPAQTAFSRSLGQEVAGRAALRGGPPAPPSGPKPPIGGGQEDEAARLLREAEEDFLGQRRGVRSHEETTAAAEAIRAGLTTDDVVRMGQSGVAVNAETLVAANGIGDEAAEAFIKAVNRGAGDPVSALVDTLKVQKAVRGFIAEGGRVTEANKLIKDEIADRLAKDQTTAAQAIRAVRGLDNPDNLKAVVGLAKGLDFSNKDEVRRFLNVVLDLGEAEAKAKIPAPGMGDNILSAINTPKTIMASLDFSAPFRQGAILSVGHPGIAARSVAAMIKSAANKNFARDVMREINTSEFALLRRNAGLYLSDWENAVLKNREEAFMSNLASKIPGVSGSNRAYAIYLNKLRADVFDQTVKSWGTKKKPSEYKALASFINYATGRGDLGVFNSSAPLLNAMFFSPRLLVSRPQAVLAPAMALAGGNPAAAKAGAAELVKFVGAGVAVLSLAQNGGAKVELDPRSSKFGKIEIGPHQIDIWAGFQPVARYVTQFITGERKTGSGDIVVTDGSGPFGETRLDTALRFARSKLSPPASLGVDALSGKDFVGDKVDPASAAGSRLVPLGWQQVKEAVEADRKDAIRGTVIGLLGMIGLGTVSIGDGTEEPLIENPFNPTDDVDREAARLNVDVPKVDDYSLTATQQRDYSRAVEDARHNALAQLLIDPRYQSLSPTAKREEWEKTSRVSADAGRKAYGIQLASNGINQEEIVAGTILAVRNTTSNYGRAEVVALLTEEGVINDEVKELIDSKRRDNELTVDQYLHGRQLVEGWRNSPAFTVGNPEVWGAAKRARDQYAVLIKDMTAEERKRSAAVQTFYNTSAGGWLKTLYASDGSRNEKYVHPARRLISQDKVWERFRDAVSQEP